jgi:6-phosphogluconolactonase
MRSGWQVAGRGSRLRTFRTASSQPRAAAAFIYGVLAALVLVGSLLASPPQASSILVYIGTYTGQKSQGIYVTRLDSASGTLSAPQLAAESRNPSFLAIHPTRNYLYAANEIGDFDGQKTGSVSAFVFDTVTGMLKAINRQPSGGGGPAHISVDHTGRNVLVANYGGGSAAVLPIMPTGGVRPPASVVQHTGSSINPQRQKEPHAHSIDVDGANRFAYVADLGIDKVMIYRFDQAKGTLTASDPAFVAATPGAGPRHVALHPRSQAPFAYVINEIESTVTAYARDATRGTLTLLQTISTLPEGMTVQPGFSTAEIVAHPSGRFLYGSNRGHDSIVIYAIDQKAGTLRLVGHEPTQGKTPRNFGIDPTGTFLLAANQNSDSVVVFRINPETGRLTPTGSKIDVGAPVCVKFVSPR